MSKKQVLLSKVRDGGMMTGRDKLSLVLWLSLPAILGQLSTIIMQYIDTMMVGQLGANATASIGLVSTTCWLFGGLSASIGAGFSVLDADDVCSGKVDMNQYEKFVVTFKASELPRAGGGARCMTMPINRD